MCTPMILQLYRNIGKNELQYTCSSITFISMRINYFRRNHKTLSPKVAPEASTGPRALPIIGNFLELGDKPHLSLTKLSKVHGPLMSLKLGSDTVIIVSSPQVAREVLQKHDDLCADRAPPDSSHVLDHDKVSVGWLPVGPQWRELRKICSIQLFSSQRLDASKMLRRKKVQELLDHVQEHCDSGEPVNINRVTFTTSLNLLSNTLFSMDLAKYGSSNSQEFRDHAWRIMELLGKPNIADYIHMLKFIDPQGKRRQLKHYFKKMMSIFDDIFDQRLKLRASSSVPTKNVSIKGDVLDALIDLAEEGNDGTRLSCFKHLLMDLFVAGTDTTSSTVEWAMAELLRNPTKLDKAKKELEQILTKGEAVQESDISNLPYLQAVVKETFRLHPAAPFLVPHRARADVEINGYTIPQNSKILVNVYAIGRDPDVWSDPNSFVPERFLGSEIDYKGQHFELLPFGAGRRICPGISLAERMVPLMLASLLQMFDWKLGNGQAVEEMDMIDKFGLTLQKAVPLQVIPIKI